MRKTMLVALASVFGICVLIVAANAATTWQGPPSNCFGADITNCNTDGVVWNRTTPAQTGSFNLSGSGVLGTGLTIQAGDLNANSSIYLKQNGDLWLTDGKSIVVNQAGTSHLLIGNFTSIPNSSNVEVTIFGDLKVDYQPGKTYSPKISTPSLCLSGDCRSNWPAAGGGGDITSVTAGTGLTGGGLTGDVTLSVPANYQLPQSCTNGQVAKSNGAGVWTCQNDTDTNSGGDITSVNAGSGLTGGGLTGDVTLTLGNGYKLPQGCVSGKIPMFDGTLWQCSDVANDTRYILKNQNDSTSGTITINSAGTYGLDSTGQTGVIGRASNVNNYGVYGQGGSSGSGVYGYSSGNIGVYGNGGNYGVYGYSGYMGVYANAGTFGVYASAPIAGTFYGNSGYYSQLGTAGNSIYAYGPANFTGGNVTISNSLCLGGICNSSWPSGVTGATTNQGLVMSGTTLGLKNTCSAGQTLKYNGTTWECAGDLNSGGTVTAVNAGTGIASTGGTTPTISVSTSYQLPQSCLPYQIPVSDGAGNWSCTTLGAGTGLNRGGTSYSIAPAYQLPQTCSNGQLTNYDFATGKWICTSDINLTTNRYGVGGTNYSMSPCTFENTTFNAGVTSRIGCINNPGYFMAGVEYSNISPFRVVGIWCCPL